MAASASAIEAAMQVPVLAIYRHMSAVICHTGQRRDL